MKYLVLLLIFVSQIALSAECWYVPAWRVRVEDGKLLLGVDVPCVAKPTSVSAIQVKNGNGTHSFGIEILKSECGPLPPITNLNTVPIDPAEGISAQLYTFPWGQTYGPAPIFQPLGFAQYVSSRSREGHVPCDLPQRPVVDCKANPETAGCAE